MLHPRPCDQLSASQGLHVVIQLRRVRIGPADTRFLGHGQVWPPWQLRAVHKFVYCQGLSQWGGERRANNKGKPDQLRFRHYRLNKLGNMTLEILTAADKTIIVQRDAL